MGKIEKLFAVVLATGLIVLAVVAMQGHSFAVLNPSGLVADRERRLIYITLLLSLIVVIPVFIMTFVIVWRYREHKQAEYRPDWGGNKLIESVWWGVPMAIITILAVITWQSSHQLDPFRHDVAKTDKNIDIQVVALQWKWLFIYPDQNIATINYVQIPEHTLVHFEVTADAPMNSFWIPELGGQIYAMPGMSTQLHLIADKPGEYRGSSANLSGSGFAGMHFMARATSSDEFDQWVREAKAGSRVLTAKDYGRLAQPKPSSAMQTYAAADDGLYAKILDKYMVPGREHIVASQASITQKSYGVDGQMNGVEMERMR